MKPTCVLDFYVHESAQRSGHGRRIYESMLEKEGILPERLAIDKPSKKFLNFMEKYYGLKEFVPQGSGFVLFKEFFETKPQVLSKVTVPRSSRNKLIGLDSDLSGFDTDKLIEANSYETPIKDYM